MPRGPLRFTPIVCENKKMTGPAEPSISSPYFLSALVGGRCDLHCPFCGSWRRPIPEMSGSQWAALWREWGAWLPGRHVTLAGGEPLLHPEIGLLVRSLKDTGLRASISTSGGPLTMEMARLAAAWPLDGITISLDAPAALHDRLRGRAGLHDQCLRFIDYLKELRPELVIGVAAIICRANLAVLAEHLEQLLAKPQVDVIYLQAVVNLAGGPNLSAGAKSSFFPPAKKAEAFLDWLEERRRRTAKIVNTARQIAAWRQYFRNSQTARQWSGECRVGDYTLNIAPNGDVVLCDFFSPIGNVTVNNVKDLWYGEQAARLREQMRSCTRSCNCLINCGFDDLQVRLFRLNDPAC